MFTSEFAIRFMVDRRSGSAFAPPVGGGLEAKPVRGGSLMLMPYALVALLALILAGPAHAQVHVDIGIHLPAPPQLVIVPGVATVRYAPSAPANFFFYGDQY